VGASMESRSCWTCPHGNRPSRKDAPHQGRAVPAMLYGTRPHFIIGTRRPSTERIATSIGMVGGLL
jgi:hypothetical protein